MTHAIQRVDVLVMIVPAGCLNRQQRAAIDYLVEENCPIKDRVEGRRWDLLTAGENGIARVIRGNNSLTNAENPNRGAVLAKPFPCLVSQWVTCSFDNNYSQL
jgi:hypothetical protein